MDGKVKQERNAINLDDNYDVLYRTSKLKYNELKKAVPAAGNSIEAIKIHLNKA